jgi:Zn ribbon nucleic-acid-binding protein
MVKQIKVYMCPKCKSKNVMFMQRLGNLFGIFPVMECRDCGHKARIFPQLVFDKRKLLENKLDNLEREIKEGVESEKEVGTVMKRNSKKDVLDSIPRKKTKKKSIKKVRNKK